jgi:hypothetical protein
MPALRVFLNLDNLVDLRPDSIFPSALLAPGAAAARDARLAADGFEGVQVTDNDPLPAGATLPHCGLDRINAPAEAHAIFARHAARGDRCITLHVGWGIEDDAEIDALLRAILDAQQKHRLPAYIETHRATITQDMWRTVQLTKRFPEVRFNIDLSHYYCGQEMVYGDWQRKLAFMQPIFDRTGFMHGRIAAPGWMQAPIERLDAKPRLAHGADYLAHFREMWTRAMSGFLRHAQPADELIFAPELLRADIYYARKFPAARSGTAEPFRLVEESDRYAQALLYRDLARECWAAACAR